MTVYRYKAVPLQPSAEPSGPLAGELAAESPAALRASLRRAGLQVIEAKPAHRKSVVPDRARNVLAPFTRALQRHTRSRRVRAKAELYDSLATMLQAGLPIVDAVTTLLGGRTNRSTGTMLVELREAMREGAALDEAMQHHPWWFEPAEVAMVSAARASGELPSVLETLAQRQERAGALAAKLASALTYPAVVSVVGIGVVIFLSVKTLPDLTTILIDAGVEPPRLTLAVMAFGQGLLRHGVLLGAVAILATVGALVLLGRLGRAGLLPLWTRRIVPGFARRLALARAWAGIAELVRTGVPVVDALRLTSLTTPTPTPTTTPTSPTTPTSSTPSAAIGHSGSLGSALQQAATSIERGGSLSESLPDPVWFDDECRRLISIGESSGELPEILSKLAERSHRSAARSIDRLASLLEPAVILMLATLIGIVVMSAVLPILKLQEIIA
ncbi:MAG: type II secretion system F family protein [Planctomycetota bacterium]|nr:type II secretion system F family protein [Planctomycetota bacterium]